MLQWPLKVAKCGCNVNTLKREEYVILSVFYDSVYPMTCNIAHKATEGEVMELVQAIQ